MEPQSGYWTHITSTVFPMSIMVPIKLVKQAYFDEQDFTREELLEQRKKARTNGFDVKDVMRVTIGYISEDKLHDKCFVQHVLNDGFRWVQRYTTSKNVFVVSDGAKSQFKSVDMIGWCGTVKKIYGFHRFEWHFFASCHGKCICKL